MKKVLEPFGALSCRLKFIFMSGARKPINNFVNFRRAEICAKLYSVHVTFRHRSEKFRIFGPIKGSLRVHVRKFHYYCAD